MNRYKELIGGTCFFIFAAVYFIMALSIPKFNDGFVSSDFMPKLYGVLLMILSVIQVLQGVSRVKKEPRETKETEKKSGIPMAPEVLLTFLFLILYVVILKPLGFLIATILFLLAMITMFTPKESRSFLRTVLISVIFSVVVYLIFVKGLSLTLPEGFWK